MGIIDGYQWVKENGYYYGANQIYGSDGTVSLFNTDALSEQHKEGFIRTYSGIKVYPYAPRAEDIRLRDIAFALADLHRFTGHGIKSYSVAEHCVLGSYVIPEHKAWFLLHDAPEYVFQDINSPTKKPLTVYKKHEALFMNVIAFKWLRGTVMPDLVHKYDEGMLWNEVRQNVNYGPEEVEAMKNSPNGYLVDIPLQFWDRATAAQKYIDRFYELKDRGEITYDADFNGR